MLGVVSARAFIGYGGRKGRGLAFRFSGKVGEWGGEIY